MFAMELLIGELIKAGAHAGKTWPPKFSEAENVLQFRTQDGDVTGVKHPVLPRNISNSRASPCSARIWGGNCGRKLLFFTATAKALVKRFDIEQRKRNY